MSTAAGSSLIGAIALGWALILFYKKRRKSNAGAAFGGGGGKSKAPTRFMVFLMLIAGFFLSGGVLGTVIRSAGTAARTEGANLTGEAFGVGTPLVLAFFAAVWIIHDWRTKDIEPATPWIALIAPMMLPVAAGLGSYFAGATAPAVTTIQAFLGG
jgi:hypothetical protein